MGFVYIYRVLWILRALRIILSETINISRNLQPQKKDILWDALKDFTIVGLCV